MGVNLRIYSIISGHRRRFHEDNENHKNQFLRMCVYATDFKSWTYTYNAIVKKSNVQYFTLFCPLKGKLMIHEMSNYKNSCTVKICFEGSIYV